MPGARPALTALALGLAACALLLAGGRLWQAWNSRPAQERWAVVEQERRLPAKVSGSRRLPKGHVLVLREGEPERWAWTAVSKRGGPFEPQRRLRRLKRGVAAELIKGSGLEPAPIAIPRVALVRRSLSLTATAYDSGPVDPRRGWVGSTSIGERARPGIAAVDPKLIPYRSLLYVYGYGPALAADTGGAIRGRRIDLCFESSREARAYGRQRTRVLVLERLGGRRARAALAEAGLDPERP